MSTLEQFLGERVNNLGGGLEVLSRNILNTKYPAEFEAYFVSLELVTPNNDIEEYFTFPINPISINKIEPRTKSIERTFGKIIVNKSDRFTPQDLTIKGNFGRDFKILVRQKGELSFNSILSISKFLSPEEFNPIIKSGYGSFKILQNICKKSETSIGGKPMKLYLHNYFLGESYLVEVIDFSADQSVQQNMMWNYTLRLKIISPLDQMFLRDFPRSIVNVTQDSINKSLKTVKNLTSSLLT